MLILHPSGDGRLFVKPFVHIGRGQLVVVPNFTSCTKAYGQRTIWVRAACSSSLLAVSTHTLPAASTHTLAVVI